MSAELIATAVSMVSLLLAVVGGGWAIIRRSDAQFQLLGARVDAVRKDLTGLDLRLRTKIEDVEERLTARIDAVKRRLTGKIEEVDRRLSAKIDVLQQEVVETKISVARLEGPIVRRLELPR